MKVEIIILEYKRRTSYGQYLVQFISIISLKTPYLQYLPGHNQTRAKRNFRKIELYV